MDGQVVRKGKIESIKSPSGGPFKETVQEPQLSLVTSPDGRKFEVRCNAGDAGHLAVASDSVSVQIGQRIRKEGKEEFWGSVLIECKEQDDGSLAVDVIIFHPEWDEPLKIASIQSNPSDGDALEPVLRCDVEQKHL